MRMPQLVPGKRVVRVMPNTPCLVSESAAAFALGSNATEEDKEVVQNLMGAVGYACEVKEYQIDGERACCLFPWIKCVRRETRNSAKMLGDIHHAAISRIYIDEKYACLWLSMIPGVHTFEVQSQ